MHHPTLTREAAEAVWKVLVEEAGASDDDREMFFHAQARGCTEYRFCGMLGFGGKFWHNAGRWHVTCYPEDETVLKRIVIERANKRLAALLARFVDNCEST
jgi:hypothetical protein